MSQDPAKIKTQACSILAPGPWPLAPGPWPLAPGPWFSCSEGLGTYAFPALFSGFPGMHVGSEA